MLGKFVKKLIEISQGTRKTPPQTPPSPQEVFRTAVREIEEAIAKANNVLLETRKHHQQISQNLERYQDEANQLHNQAAQYLKKNNEIQAQATLQRKTIADKQVAQYQQLRKNLEVTIFQLEKQIADLKFRLEEILTKEKILTAQLAGAKSQKEVQDFLNELNSDAFDAIESDIVKAEAEAGLASDILEVDKKIEEFEANDSMDELRKHLNEEERRAQEREIENRRKKLNALFGNDKAAETAEKKNLMQQKQQLLESFNKVQSESTQITNKSLVENFFSQQNEEKNTNKPSIEDFFKDSEKVNKNTLPNPINNFDDFFKQDEKKKKIDDFFKD